MALLRVNLAEYLHDTDKGQLNVPVPEPLFVRIDQLIEIVQDSALARGRRLGDLEGNELVAALIFGAPKTDKQLVPIIERYREARIYEAFTDETRTTGKRKLPARGPGRKRRIGKSV